MTTQRKAKVSQKYPNNCLGKTSSKKADGKHSSDSNSSQKDQTNQTTQTNQTKKKSRKQQQQRASSGFNSVKTTNYDISIIDAKFSLSDERLKNILSHTYEHGRSDAQKFHFCDHWGTCFSITFTASIPLWTADFRDFWKIPGNLLRDLVFLLFLGSLLVGIVFFILSLFNKNKEDANKERDTAVEKAIENLKLQAVTVKGSD